MGWEWKDILGFSVIAAFITAALNQGSTWLFALWQKKQSADFDAVRLAVALERFAYQCADRISDEQTWRDSGGNAGGAFYELPSMGFPSDVAWKNLELELVDRVLVLENDLMRSESIIKGELEHLTAPENKANEPREQAGLIGYRAHTLAQDLRARYQPNRRVERLHAWDHIATLKMKHDLKIEEYRASNAAANGMD
jgi:hypothetical protein